MLLRDILAHHHHRFTYRGVLTQHTLDLTQLDSEAAQLHLLIDAPAKHQPPIRLPTHQVPRPVQSRPRLCTERMRHKTLGSQRRLLVITARQPLAPNVQLSWRSEERRVGKE